MRPRDARPPGKEGVGGERARAQGSVVRNATVLPSGRCATKGKISQSPAARGRRTYRARVPVRFRVSARDTQVIRGEPSEVIAELTVARGIPGHVRNSSFAVLLLPAGTVGATSVRVYVCEV